MGDVQPEAGAGEGLGLVRLEPEQLAKGEGRVGSKTGQRVQPRLADLGFQPGELRLRPLVVPGDRPAGRPAVRIEGDERLADARHGQTHDAGRLGDPRGGIAKRAAGRQPERLRLMLGPAGPRPLDRSRPAALGHQLARRREQQSADAARAAVDPGEQRLVCAHASALSAGARPPRRPCRPRGSGGGAP